MIYLIQISGNMIYIGDLNFNFYIDANNKS